MADLHVADDGSTKLAGTRYEDDLYTWTLEQVELLKARRFDEIDVEHVAEELSDVAGSQYSKLWSALRVLLMHMLKWDQQPEMRSMSWVHSIREQRRRHLRLMKANPGLKSRQDEALAEAYDSARDWASLETNMPDDEFPATCPYDWDDILNRPFGMDAER